MSRTLRVGLVALLITWLAVMPIAAAPAAREAPTAEAVAIENAPTVQQFSAGGHVLGVLPTGVYVASATHAWHVDFVNAQAVTPMSTQSAVAVKQTGSALPLSTVVWRGLWPGINLAYQAADGAIAESVYTLAPGAEVSSIRLRYNGSPHLTDEGRLAVAFADGEMQESAPRAWQEINGEQTPVTVAYRLIDDRTVGFALGSYDPAAPVVIDPDVVWVSFMGGIDYDDGSAIAVDGSGNVYVVGSSPFSWGSPERAYTWDKDAFVAKLDSDGKLVWNTFLGGLGIDEGVGIGLDSASNVYVSGISDTTWGSPRQAYAHWDDTFVAKLNSSGALQWSTFVGGERDDSVRAMAVTSGGISYLVGDVDGTFGTPLNPFAGGYDTWVAKLNSSGDLLWSTFVGGAGGEFPKAVVTDGSANVYIAGGCTATWGANPVHAFGAKYEGYVAKLNSSGTLQWNTFQGGAEDDLFYSIARDSAGNLFVGGSSGATWGAPVSAFPAAHNRAITVVKLNSSGALVWNTFLPSYGTPYGMVTDNFGDVFISGETGSDNWGSPILPAGQNWNMFAAQLNNTTGALGWNTFLGGDQADWNGRLAIDSAANLYVVGRSGSSWQTPVRAYSGGYDAMAVKLSTSGILLWNSYMGGGANDFTNGIAIDSANNVYVVGYSNMTWGTPVREYYGRNDAFVAKLDAAGVLVWNTFLGGTGDEYGNAITVDRGTGHVFVAGSSTAGWVTAPVQAYHAGSDGFAAELDGTGALLWNTFIGGSGNEYAYGIARDGAGMLYVIGTGTASWGANIVRIYTDANDAWAAKLNSGGVYMWNTFLGGSGSDGAYGVALTSGATPNVIVVGSSGATWGNSPVHGYVGNGDGFVASVNSFTGALNWHTFLGGSGGDSATAVAVDASNAIYVAGSSAVAWGTPVRPYTAGLDAFVVKLNAAGGLVWLTFLGGSSTDYLAAIALSANNDVYVVGNSSTGWGVPPDGARGGGDAFAARLNARGYLLWNTFIGTSASDYGGGVAVDTSHQVYAAGYTFQRWAAQRNYTPGWDTFVTKLTPQTPTLLPMVRGK